MAVDYADFRNHAAAGSLFVGIVMLLVSGFLVPGPLKRELVLRYEAPTIVSAYASHFVHLSPSHLLTNVLAIVLLFPLTYGLSVYGRRRRTFVAAVLTYLFAFPPALSWLNIALARPRIGFGFSGVAMAFLGLMPLMIGVALEKRTGLVNAVGRSPGLFLLGLASIAWLAVPWPNIRTAITGVTMLGGVWFLAPSTSDPDLTAGWRWLVNDAAGGFVLTGVATLVLVPFAAFPQMPTSGTSILNLYSHLLGYCLGFIVPYTTVMLIGWWAAKGNTGQWVDDETMQLPSD